MATETTPLRNGERRAPPIADHKRRIAGLAVLAVVLVIIAVLTTTSVGCNPQPQAIPQHPIKVAQPTDTTPLNGTRHHLTPAPLSDNWFQCGTEDSESGYITMPNNVDNHLFYWFFESRKAPDTDPLVLWMTGGGSGCSGLTALLTENGPCRINEDATTALNPHSWTAEANVVWLDQPVNVGFSYGNKTDAELNEKTVQENVYWFLQGFLDKHPEFEGRALFLMGEGYESHYVPAAAHHIRSNNRIVEKANATVRVNLQGIAIGNGLVNPVVQIPRTLEMAIENPYNITLLSHKDLATAKEAVPVCQQLLNVCQTNSSACTGSARYCSSSLLDVMNKSHRNVYDIREECSASDPTKCYNISAVTQYLNSQSVRAYLNVSDQSPTWQACPQSPLNRFSADLMKNIDGYVSDLLNDNAIRVLIYNGDADLVCNWYGSQAWTKQLKWKHQKEFNDVKEHDLVIAGDIESIDAGLVRSYENHFTFLRVFKAGHMVPKDQPAVALEMINRFLRKQNL